MNKSGYYLLILLVTLLLFTQIAIPATRISSQSGNWSATSTWGGNPAPVAGDDVIINGGFSVSVDISSAVCLSLQLGGSTLGTGSGAILFTGGSHLIVFGPVTLGVTNNTPGTLTMTNGGTLTCEGLVDNRLGTWTPGTGTIEFTATNSVPNNNNIDFNNLTVSAGTTALTRNVTVAGNLLVKSGAVLDGGANILTFGGDWVNNGTFTGNTGTVTFNKNGNQSITGTGANNFNLIRLNMGASVANTLEVLSSNFTAPDGFLTLTSGTFKLSGTFTFASTFFVGPSYNIQPTAGLWINNPNITVTAQAGGVSLRGLLRISAGTYNVGTATDNSLAYVTGASMIVEGGSLHIAGNLAGNNATATISYAQSGGGVTIVEQGSTDPAFGGFDLGAAGSSFTMSGGTLVVRNATSGPADFRNLAATASVTGGTLRIGDALTANAQTIRIQSSRPVGNLLISNATAQTTKPTAQLLGSSLNIVGTVTIQSGTTLNVSGLNLNVGGNWSDSGTFSGGNNVTFNGSGSQSLIAPSGEIFSSLTVNKAGGTFTLNSAVTVATNFNLILGTIAVGGTTLTLDGTVTGGGTLTSGSTGTVMFNQASDGQTILAENYGNLAFSDFNKILPSSAVTGISGNFSPGAASGHAVAGSTIDFNGASQSIPLFPYNNLTVSGSGTKTGAGVITVNGNLTINSGIIFTGTALNVTGSGNTNGGRLNLATLVVDSGAIMTNNGTLTTTSALSGAGTLIQGSGGTLNIGGTVGIALLDASAGGNSVNYNGSGQTVVSSVYHHLLLSGSGTPNLTGVSTINGDLSLSGSVAATAVTGLSIGGTMSISAGASLDAGAFSHSLKGNLNRSGIFLPNTGSITLNGTSPQTVSSSTFNNLIVSNPSGVSMLGDDTIGGTLTLSAGSFSIGSHTLTFNGALSIGSGTLAGGASSNVVVGGSGPGAILPGLTLNNLTLARGNGLSIAGDMTVGGLLSITNGTLNTGANTITLGSSGILSENQGNTVAGNIRTTRNVTAVSGIESFGTIGAEIVLNGVAPGITTVVRTTGTASSGAGHNSIKRFFDITPATNTGLNAGLVFHYDTSEVNGQNPNGFELYRSHDGGSTWTDLGGTANPVLRTVTLTELNNFSRWTISDTGNRVGSTITPVMSGINPISKYIGDTGFTLTVLGTDFVNGRSIVRYNGSDRTTVFVNPGQLIATIPAGDLLTIGTFPVTLFTTGGGGVSNTKTFTVNPLPPSKILVETVPNGSGHVVSAQSVVSGNSITVYAITRDSLNNFVANVSATSWALGNVTGGVVAGDLAPSVDGKSALFTGHIIGTANIKATSGVLAPSASGTITVTAGTAATIRVETAANGSGTIVPAQSLASGVSTTLFAVTRDASNNYISNVSADAWSLQNITGGVAPGDLLPALDGKSALFTGHSIGSAGVKATSGALATTLSGTITVTSGLLKRFTVEANGGGPIGNQFFGTAFSIRITAKDSSDNTVTSFNETVNLTSSGILIAGGGSTSALTNGVLAAHSVSIGSTGTVTITATRTAGGGQTGTSNPFTVDVGLTRLMDEGWNMVSVPFTAGDYSKSVLYPTATSEAFSYAGSYTINSVLANGAGYWLNFGAGQSVQMTGLVRVSDTITVLAGWNLIGSISTPLPVVSVTSLPSGMITSKFFGYKGGYQIADTIQPGFGYWVKVGQSGTLIFSASASSSAKIRISETSEVPPAPPARTVAGAVPVVYAVVQNYPNPFNPSTEITYSIEKTTKATLKVYDILGREVATLVSGEVAPGQHAVTWNAAGLPSGVYLYRLTAGSFVQTKKMMLMK